MADPKGRFVQVARRRAAGFTLFELIITVAIIAILAGLALPNYREFSIGMTVSDNTNDLLGALNLARSEAIKRGRPVALIANGGSWNDGWQVVAGKQQADGSVLDPEMVGSTDECAAHVDIDDETPLCARFEGALPETYTIAGKATGGGGVEDDRVVFNPTGALGGGATTFDFNVCRPTANADATKSRRIHVEPSGTVSARRDVTGSPAGSCS